MMMMIDAIIDDSSRRIIKISPNSKCMFFLLRINSIGYADAMMIATFNRTESREALKWPDAEWIRF